MLKNIFCLIFLISLPFSIYSQIEVIAKSEYFKEPEWGHLKIVAMKNGETALVRFDKGGDIHFSMYDANYKLRFIKELKPQAKFSFNGGKILGIFESNKQIVLFYSSSEFSKNILYRVLLDPLEGSIIGEKEIGELKSLKGGGFAIVPTDITVPNFFLRRDEHSENYAIVLFNSYVSNRNERIEVIHFDSTHNEISRAFNHSPDEKYKFMEYLDLIVRGDKEVILAVQGSSARNPQNSSKPSSLYLGRLSAGSKTFDLQDLDYADSKYILKAMLKYNIHSKDLLLLTQEYPKKSGSYEANLIKINKQNEIRAFDITTVKVKEIAATIYKKKNAFEATPQNLIVNSDGTFTIVFEEISHFFTDRKPRTNLEDIGIIKYDSLVNEVNAAYLPKFHALSYEVPYMYHSINEHKGVQLLGGLQFKSFEYIHTGNKEYVLFNDIERNQEAIDNGNKVTVIYSVDESQAYLFDLNSGQKIPKRKPLFKIKEDGKQLLTLLLFNGSDYNPDTRILATMSTSSNRKKDRSRMVWIKFE